MSWIIDDDFLYANMPQTEKAMLSNIPPEDKLHHKFSRRFNRKMAALLKHERRTPTMRVFVRQMKTAAAVFVIVLSMAFGTVMSVEAYRIRFFEFVTIVWEELTSIVIGSEENADHDVLIPVDPTYIPQGFEVVDRQSDQYENTIRYLHEDGVEILYSQQLTTQSEFIFDTKDIEPNRIMIGSQEVYTLLNKGTTQLYWNDNFNFYHLISRSNESELLKMAESIIKK